MATGRISWAEVAGPPDIQGRIFWAEVSEPAPVTLHGRIFWAEVAEPPAPTLAGRIFWAEVSEVAADYILVADPGEYLMEWAGSTGLVVLEADPGAYSVVGASADLVLGLDGYVLTAETGAFVLTGNDVGFVLVATGGGPLQRFPRRRASAPQTSTPGRSNTQ